MPYQAVPEGGLSEWTKEAFLRDDALIFVGACGIAVRSIAPYVRDKFQDPAVVCVDEAGQFVIPLLPDMWAERTGWRKWWLPDRRSAGGDDGDGCGEEICGDMFAKDHGFVITDRRLAKEISADILAGEPVGVFTDFDFQRGKDSGGTF